MNSPFKYIPFLWILLLICSISKAGKLDLILQSAHSKPISCLAVSPDGKYFATGGEDHVIKLWDAVSGTVLRNFTAHNSTITHLEFSKENYYLASLSESGQALIWRVETNPDNEIIDPSTTYSNTLQKKYTLTYNNHEEYKGAGQETAGGFLKSYKGITSRPKSMAFGSDKKYVLAVCDEKGNYLYWDTKLSKPRSTYTYKSGLSPANAIILISGGKKIITLDGKQLTLRKITGEPISHVSLSKEAKSGVLLQGGKKFVVNFDNGEVAVFSTSDLKKIKTIPIKVEGALSVNKSQSVLFGTNDQQINAYQIEEDKTLNLKNQQEDKSDWLHLGYASSGLLIGITQSGAVIAKSPQSGSTIYRRAQNKAFDNIKISPNWRFVANIDLAGNYLQVTDLFHGNTYSVQPDKRFQSKNLLVSAKHVAIELPGEMYNLYDLENGFLWKQTNQSEAERLLDLDNAELMQEEPIVEVREERKLTQNQNKSIFPTTFSPDGKWLFMVTKDNEVQFYNWTEDKRFRMLIDARGTILVSPENNYFESGNGHELVYFRSNDEVYSFEQFDLHFNRPDKVLRRLVFPPASISEMYKKAYDLRLKRLGYKNSRVGNSFHVPKIKIVAPPGQMIETTNANEPITIKAWDTKYKLKSIQVRINGSIVETINVKSKAVLELEQKLTLYLTGGTNRIEVVVENEKGARSLAARIFAKRIGEFPKPNLYVFSIGASKFVNESMNLNYARKDALDVVKAFEGKSTAFEKVLTYTLTDEQVTLENIQKTIEEIKKCRPDDHCYLFVASHGILDEQFDLYLATHDVDFSNPAEKGLAYAKLEKMLEEIPSRHKLLVMDACHSGELDQSKVKKVVGTKTEFGNVVFRGEEGASVETTDDMNYLDLMKGMFNETQKSSGATIISSAGGTEYAMEGAKWKNGVFTYALLNGLNSGAADLDYDGIILLSELNQYLVKKVPELTNGNQKPTSRTVNASDDIPLWNRNE